MHAFSRELSSFLLAVPELIFPNSAKIPAKIPNTRLERDHEDSHVVSCQEAVQGAEVLHICRAQPEALQRLWIRAPVVHQPISLSLIRTTG